MKQIILSLLLLFSSTLGYARQADDSKTKSGNMSTEKKCLVAFFSRADENYAVGYIEKGNTHIVAEMIAAATGADMFHIKTVKPYPAAYNECIEVARREKQSNARPEIDGDIRVEDYDVIFLGYPNWWGEMPMAVYTFIEKHDWRNKIVIPFCTHEGSGLSGTERRVQAACEGAKELSGLAVRGNTAQNERETAKKAVLEFTQTIQKQIMGK